MSLFFLKCLSGCEREQKQSFDSYKVCSNSVWIGVVVVVPWCDVFATSLDMFVHILATHDTRKWLRLLSWL